MSHYIQADCQDNFKQFKYNGGNDSLTYQHVWSPLAQKLLEYTPNNIAPNLITLTSLVILTISHILFIFVGDNSHGFATWKLLVMAASIFVYQNLDNLDGKQARKTNSSSPLGMLFDHGTDAVASFLISLQVLTLLQLQNISVRIFCLFSFVMIIYFCAMWSQYSVGYFRLGRINPVDQGLPSYALITLTCIFLPQNFWNTYHWFSNYNQEVISILAVLVVLIIYFMIKDNFIKAVRPRKEVLKTLLLPLSFAVALISLYLFKDGTLETAYIPLCYSLMFSWSRNMIEIQVYFVTKQRFNPFNFGTLSFVVPAIMYLFLDFNAYNYFWGVTFFTSIVFFEFVISVLNQGANLLGIRVLSLQRVVKSA